MLLNGLYITILTQLRHQGGVVLVSHDDRLVSMVADELWVVTPGPSKEVPGKVTVFEGSFEAFT